MRSYCAVRRRIMQPWQINGERTGDFERVFPAIPRAPRVLIRWCVGDLREAARRWCPEALEVVCRGAPFEGRAHAFSCG